MKHFRHLEHGPRAERAAAMFARQFGTVERVARIAVGAAAATAEVLGHRTVTAATTMARAVVSKDLIPGWLPNMPAAAKAKLPKTPREGATGVYFTSCVNRIFGRQPGQQRKLSLQEAMIAVSARAGMPLWIPEDVGGHCCATIWHSKGYVEGNAVMANRTVESLWRWSDSGRLPIVCDASSCSLGSAAKLLSISRRKTVSATRS